MYVTSKIQLVFIWIYQIISSSFMSFQSFEINIYSLYAYLPAKLAIIILIVS